MTGRPIPYLAEYPELTSQEQAALALFEPRLGPSYIQGRLDFERAYEAHVVRQNARLLSLERWLSSPTLIRGGLRLLGLHERSRRNALAIEVRHREVNLPHLPDAFEGFSLLHLSDLHLDMNETFLEVLVRLIKPLNYDLCVLTGDYRALTYGPYEAAVEALRRLHTHIKSPAYAVLGNHDTIRMVPAMEAMGYHLLLNEATRLSRGDDAIYLAGVDDADFQGTLNFDRAAHDIAPSAISILLTHTPETYRHAAQANFNFMLCGHTHGGQLCLPGGLPIRTESKTPRRFVRGAWQYGSMVGYTSAGAGTCIVDARLNCPPEITLHRLRRGPARIHTGTVQ